MTSQTGASSWRRADSPVLGGFAYWRKSALSAAAMVPLVLTLVEGRFTAVDQHGSVVFDAEAQDVSSRLSLMGTLTVVVHGRRFALVGRGSLGGREPSLSLSQRERLQKFFEVYPHAAALQRGFANVLDAAFNVGPDTSLRIWRDGLSTAGAAIN